MVGAAPGDGAVEPPGGALCVLCGLPGAGKSTLAAHLLESAPRELSRALGRRVRVWHVCFDTVVEALETERGASAFDPEIWHDARRLVLASTRRHFSAADASAARPATRPLPQLGRCAPADDEDGAAPFELVVLDDNMVYRSMRRAYWRVARDLGLGYATLACRAPLDVALARNAGRAAPVAEATVRHMAEVIEWPESGGAHAWEAHVPHDEPAGVPWAPLARALSAPPPPSAEPSAEASSSAAAATAASAAHTLDLRLRRAAALHLGSADAARLEPSARAALARALSDQKKTLLARARAARAGHGAEEAAAACDADVLDAAFAAAFARAHHRFQGDGSGNSGAA